LQVCDKFEAHERVAVVHQLKKKEKQGEIKLKLFVDQIEENEIAKKNMF
jgi:hypothetical protein